MATSDTHFVPRIPHLNLPDDFEMLSQFVSEGFSLLRDAENGFTSLKAIPQDKDRIETIFKVFHTLRGLAGFLNLEDISVLAQEIEKLLDLLRKGQLECNQTLLSLMDSSLTQFRSLFNLLDEQIKNNGELKTGYCNVGDILVQLRQASNLTADKVEKVNALQKNIHHSDASPTKNISTEDLQAQYEQLRRKYNELLSRQAKILEISDKTQLIVEQKSEFFASTAHEIRVLINAILGFSQLLLNTSLDEKQKDHVNIIVSSGGLLLNIVNHILDFSKIEAGHLQLEQIPFNLDDIVQEVGRIIGAKIQEKSLRFELNISNSIPNYLVGDPTRLKQILLNLFDNALKFTKQGKVGLSIDVAQGDLAHDVGHDETMLLFVIEDTGAGIPLDRRGLLFKSFSQSDSSVTRKYGGTGLGLAICKSYVEAMGGKIWVDSEVSKGSRFNFTAKFKVTSFDAIEKSRDIQQDHYRDALEMISCHGIKVLVAEDSEPNQELLQAFFETFGCEGTFVGNGEQAIEKLKKQSYDLCLMDLEMPIMGGVEATRLIRREINPQLPIVALTAATSKEEQETSKRAGITDYLMKPIDVLELKEKILRYTRPELLAKIKS